MIENIPSAEIVVTVRGETHVFQTGEWCEIDRHKLDEELARQAAAHAWIGVVAERAKSEALLLQAELEDLDADTAVEFADRPETKELSATAANQAVKLTVKSNPKRKHLVRRYLAADAAAREMQALSYAMIHRMAMLESLSKARGGELSSPSVAELDRSKKYLLGKRI